MLLLVAMPFVTSSFLFLVVGPGATSSVLAANSEPFLLVASLICFMVLRFAHLPISVLYQIQ